VIMFMPYGLVPGCAQLWRRVRNRGKRPSGAAVVRAHDASQDARERDGDTRPESGSSARDTASEPAQ
jgi:hypothetical protein